MFPPAPEPALAIGGTQIPDPMESRSAMMAADNSVAPVASDGGGRCRNRTPATAETQARDLRR